MASSYLELLKKDAVGLGEPFPQNADYTVLKLVNHQPIMNDYPYLSLGPHDNMECTVIKIYPLLESIKSEIFYAKIGMSYDLPFTVGQPGSQLEEYKWHLKLFPSGINKFCKGYMSLFVCLEEAPLDQSVEVNFSLTGFHDSNFMKKFSVGEMWGFSKWRVSSQLTCNKPPKVTIKYSCSACLPSNSCQSCSSLNITRVTSNKYLCNACNRNFTSCPHGYGINVTESPSRQGQFFLDFYLKMKAASQPTSSSQSSSLTIPTQLFTQIPNIILNIKKASYYFYKEILIKESDVFAAMFKHDTHEKQTSTADINIEIDNESLEFILSYLIYSHRIKYDKDKLDWTAILNFANYYNLKNLKTLAGYQLLSSVTVDTSVGILITADLNNIESLKSYCLNYISNNIVEVKLSDSWKKLKDFPLLLFELCDLSFNQSSV